MLSLQIPVHVLDDSQLGRNGDQARDCGQRCQHENRDLPVIL
jgi:hypothetical protein